ncbi:hypothetical protein G7Y79_00030g064100 [Physcia stellaris]|nr:hypothetical protein G7Y79_00030g064100 [Physcia stellaris]
MQVLLDGPAMVPPSGIEPNFVNPENETRYFVLTVVLTITVSTFAFLMRVYTKTFLIRKAGWEDYTLILGYLLFIGYCVPTSLLIKAGGGVHQWDIQVKALIPILYYTNITSIIYCFTTFIIKLSILLQYLKIFPPVQKKDLMCWGTYLLIWLNFGFYIADIFAELFLCSPREKYWNVLITTGHCYSATTVNIASGTFNTISDFLTLLLPQRVIWKLQMPLKRKLGISAIFLTGLFVCITSTLRLYYSVRLAQSGDISYNLALMGFWSYAELSVGIVCACLPVSPRFFQFIGPKLLRISRSGSWVGSILGWSRVKRRSAKESWGSDDSSEMWGRENIRTASM